MHIRVAIVEDDAEIRKLSAGLLNFYPDIECVGAFGSAEEFLDNLPTLQPDVVLMDIGLPGMDGIACVDTCKGSSIDSESAGCKAEFIMFTNHTDSREVFEALKAGATGYVLKKGWAYKQIAAHRFVSEHTVRTQVRSIYQKLQVHTRTEALNLLHGRIR